MPSNEHIFDLIQSLSKRERHHLRLMSHHFGKKETGFYRLLDELYRMREFDQDYLMARLDCKSYIVRRGMLRLFELALDARALIAPTDREKLFKGIEDIRFLIHKKAKSAALPLIAETLEACQVRELFDEQLEILGIWNRHFQPTAKEQKTIAEATREAKSARANLQEYEALQRRLEHINRREVEKRFDMLADGILNNPLMESKERCESSRARYVFHNILWRLSAYLGKYEDTVEHLRRSNFLVASYKHLFRDHEVMLLQGQCILAKVLLAIGRISEAEEVLRKVWSSDFEDDYLVAERFLHHCSIKLQFAIDSGNENLGRSAINLIELHLSLYKSELSLSVLDLLLFFAGKFHFYLQEWESAAKYFRKVAKLDPDKHQATLENAEYASFSLLMLLIQSVETQSVAEEEKILEVIKKRVRYKQFHPKYLGRIFIELFRDTFDESSQKQITFWEKAVEVLPSIVQTDITRLGFDHYLQSKIQGISPLKVVNDFGFGINRSKVSGLE